MARQTRNNRYSRKIRHRRKRPRRKRTYRKRRKRTRRRRGGGEKKFSTRLKKTLLADDFRKLDQAWAARGGAENIRLGLCSTTSKKWNKYWRHTFRRGRHLPTYIKIRQCRQKYVKLFEKLFPEKYRVLSKKIADDREVKKMEPPNSKEKKRETRQRPLARRARGLAPQRRAARAHPQRLRFLAKRRQDWTAARKAKN